MATKNFAQSMQQKLTADPDKEQVSQAEELNSMTGELGDSELEAVNGGHMWWGEAPNVADWIAGRPVG
jgi:hypothetical protein